MTELLWQVTLLLAAAFFFGAVVACSLKRRFYYGPPARRAKAVLAGVPHAPAPTEPKVEVTPREPLDGERFNRAISGQAAAAAAPQPAAAPTPAPPATPAAAPTPEARPVSDISVSTGSGAPLKPEEGGAGPSDDLMRIRGIDANIQKQLKDAGIRRFAELAALTAADIKGLGERLGLEGRIEADNWVGQALILASGGETYYSRRVDLGMPVPAFAGAATPVMEPVAAPQAAPAAPATPTLPLQLSPFGPSDDLTRIRGIDATVQSKLRELGIRHFAQLAALNAADVKTLNETFGFSARVEQENWLGQAKILATGGETYYSRRIERSQQAQVVAEPAPATVEPAPAPTPADGGPNDDLTRIRGIDAAVQGRLQEIGIRRFAQIAALKAADVKSLNEALGFNGRIEQENWLGQAQILATGGETYYSRRLDRGEGELAATAPVEPSADASPATAVAPSDVASLRSVRSEALVGSEAARAARPARETDDLKRIRGIGVLIEKKLNSLGIIHFEQVANWTGADIERISNILDFKGRIERENWIEQARILATGGQTEFSRRSEA